MIFIIISINIIIPVTQFPFAIIENISNSVMKYVILSKAFFLIEKVLNIFVKEKLSDKKIDKYTWNFKYLIK